MPRTLIIKLGAIGDVIMAIPAAYEMHRQGYAIDWLCGPSAIPVLRLYPWVNTMEVDEKALLAGGVLDRLGVVLGIWKRLIGRRYDVIATLYYDRRYRLLALPLRAGRKLQLSLSDRRFRLLPGRHHTDEYARILLGWPDEVRLAALPPVAPPRLPAVPLLRDARARIVLAPAGARNLLADDRLRRWPQEHYVALAAALLREGHEVILTGGPTDAWIQPLFADLAVVDLIGKLALPETLALLDSADVLVTHDTGPLHLGGITRCGIVGIFGPTDPRGRMPQRARSRALWGGEKLPCRPCYDGQTFAPCPANQCMAEVSPAQVIEEIHELLEAKQ